MFAISPTDLNWFQQLRTEGLQGNVINFWTPTPWNISRLKSGDNLYFMLKSPIRKIGGYGKFVEYKNMNINLEEVFFEKMEKNRQKHPVDKVKGKSTN